MYVVHQNQDTKKFEDEFQDERFLFQGDSCFPLSPTNKKDKNQDSK